MHVPVTGLQYVGTTWGVHVGVKVAGTSVAGGSIVSVGSTVLVAVGLVVGVAVEDNAVAVGGIPVSVGTGVRKNICVKLAQSGTTEFGLLLSG